MTTRLALILFLLILLAILTDVFLFDASLTLETARKGTALIQSMAFWR